MSAFKEIQDILFGKLREKVEASTFQTEFEMETTIQ